MNATAYLIADRALALICDARIYPDTAPAAIRYLDLAYRWAEAQGESKLCATILGARIGISELAKRYGHVLA